MIGSRGSSLSKGTFPAHLSVFIEHFLERRVRLAGAQGYFWPTGSFSLEQC